MGTHVEANGDWLGDVHSVVHFALVILSVGSVKEKEKVE